MSTNAVRGIDTSVAPVDMKFEIVVIPVSDVDRAKEFYAKLGWRLDADYDNGKDFRVIQFTPPGSGCSVIFGKNVTPAAPGSAQGLYLIVSDIQAARKELLDRGVQISEVFHNDGVYAGTDEPYLFGRVRVSGPDPEHRSYRSFASFRDPDGNGWLFQEITTRLAGRIDPATTTFASANDLASALRRAEAAHGAAREAHRGKPTELARLVRRVHGGGAGRDRAAEVSNSGVSSEPAFAGQTVIVMGGSSGIGVETTRLAGSEGVDVVLTGRAPPTPRARRTRARRTEQRGVRRHRHSEGEFDGSNHSPLSQEIPNTASAT